jgi:hypothetical protein
MFEFSDPANFVHVHKQPQKESCENFLVFISRQFSQIYAVAFPTLSQKNPPPPKKPPEITVCLAGVSVFDPNPNPNSF